MKRTRLCFGCFVIAVTLSACDEKISQSNSERVDKKASSSHVASSISRTAEDRVSFAELIVKSGLDAQFFASIRKLIPSECDDYELLRLLTGRNWPSEMSHGDIAREVMAYRQRLAEGAAKMKARRVTVDEDKIRALLDTVANPFLAAVFGYGATNSESYLQMLRTSSDPRGPALADYLAARAAKSGTLEALERLCSLERVDSSLHFEYAGELLKAGRQADALKALGDRLQGTMDATLSAGMKELRDRYLKEFAGLSGVQAERAEGLDGPLWSAETAANKLALALMKEADTSRKQGDEAAALRYAATAVSVAQQLEESSGIYDRLSSLSFQKMALDKLPDTGSEEYLGMSKADWVNQLNAHKVEYIALEKYYSQLKSGDDAPRFEQYSKLAGEVGQVEALRQVKASADAQINMLDPSSVTIPK